jgi:glycosyltransferase involved in cell wall biosynthesis
MKVSFVIRTRNEISTIEEVVKRIRKQEVSSDVTVEVIIVDSMSTDGTAEKAKEIADSVVSIFPEQFTWGRALNLGIEHSSGELIFIISGHCFLSSPSFVQKAIVQFESEDIVGLYGRQIPIENVDPFEEIELNMWYPDIGFIKFDLNHFYKNKVVGISNACSIIRRTAWKTCKFNEQVQSLEDTIWAFEILKQGNNLAYLSDITLYHSHIFDANYIYKKWYWRNYILLEFNKSYLNRKKTIKSTLKSLSSIYKAKVLLDTYKSYFKYAAKFKKSHRWNHTDLMHYLQLVQGAKKRSYLDQSRGNNDKILYSQISIPPELDDLQRKLGILEEKMRKSLLPVPFFSHATYKEGEV